jgi:hypothetical protein
MNRAVFGLGLALMVSISVRAQDRVPENSINCADFRRLDANLWGTTRLARFDIGNVKGNGLPANIIVERGMFNLDGADLVDVLEGACAGKRAQL